jgi:ribosomal-protein-alanine N-acetyltransferase
MTRDTTIRPLTEADAGAAAHLHAAMPEPWNAADWAGFLNEPIVLGLGAFDGDVLVGAVLARAVAGESEILTIVVATDRRRGGVGRKLLESALAESVKVGAQSAFLEVVVDNVAAISLYRNAGFVEIGRRRGYYRRSGGAVDALLMRRG